MTEEINKQVEAATAEAVEKTEQNPKDQAPSGFKPQRRNNNTGKKGFSGRGGGRGRGPRPEVPAESDYEEKNIEVSRVTRVTKGGKRMRFRVLSVIGNHKGRVGYGLAKGLDVAAATSKATTKARKALLTVPIVKETIPHVVQAKFAAAVVLLKPAPKGTGVKAGGPVRVVLELAGVPNITAKILGSNSKMNNVRATLKALKMLSAPVESAKEQQAKDGQAAEQVVASSK
ncbi:MAG TPA: 30S ribosomal protein S5 [bacterium]|nr:MAG: 30S ribosomal protein S5 [Parcubacteria group bacterium ADurb.Bin192]HPN14711.1 30S ribosomal protein S5 [bacterium]